MDKDVFICPVEYSLGDKDICEKMWCKLNIFYYIYIQMLLCLLFRMWLPMRKWIRGGDKKKWIQMTFCSQNQWDWDQYYHAVVTEYFQGLTSNPLGSVLFPWYNKPHVMYQCLSMDDVWTRCNFYMEKLKTKKYMKNLSLTKYS